MHVNIGYKQLEKKTFAIKLHSYLLLVHFFILLRCKKKLLTEDKRLKIDT